MILLVVIVGFLLGFTAAEMFIRKQHILGVSLFLPQPILVIAALKGIAVNAGATIPWFGWTGVFAMGAVFATPLFLAQAMGCAIWLMLTKEKSSA